MLLLHGTTRSRAERIARLGPDPRYREPGGSGQYDGFSTNLEAGPFHFGSAEDYATGKAREYPNEGGPVVLAVEVPDDIVRLAESRGNFQAHPLGPNLHDLGKNVFQQGAP